MSEIPAKSLSINQQPYLKFLWLLLPNNTSPIGRSGLFTSDYFALHLVNPGSAQVCLTPVVISDSHKINENQANVLYNDDEDKIAYFRVRWQTRNL